MEKVKFWKNTSSEFDKLQSKDVNTIYYITDTGKIFLGDKYYGGEDIPFSIISTEDLDKFADVTKLFSYSQEVEEGTPGSTVTPNVATGVYCYPEDVHMILGRSLTPTAYVNYMYEVSKDESATISYKKVSLDIAKGGFIYVSDQGFTISSNVDGQSSDGSGNSEGFNVTTFQAIVTEDIEASAIMSVYVTDDVQDDVTSKMYEYPFKNLLDKATNSGFKKGDVVTVTADSTGSGSMPDFSLQALSLPSKFIDDTNKDKFTSLDKLYRADGSSAVPTVDAGSYIVTEDIEFNLGIILPVSWYLDTMLSGSEELNYATGSCTLPKGSTVTVNNGIFSVSGYLSNVEYKQTTSSGSSITSEDYTNGISLAVMPREDENSIASIVTVFGFTESVKNISTEYPFTKIISDYMSSSSNVNVGDVVAVKESPHGSGSTPTLEFKSIGQDFTGQITDSNYTNYQIMSQWKDVSNGSYIVTTDKLKVQFKGKRVALSSMFLGDTAYDETIAVDKGTIIQVYSTQFTQMSQQYSKKAVYFNSSHASATSIDTGAGLSGQPILVVFDPENENNTQIFNMSEVLTACNMTSAISANAVAVALNPTDIDKWKDKTAKWDTSNGFPQLTYADDAGSKSVIPVTEINNDNFSNYDTLEKWMALDEGVYWFGNLTNSESASSNSKHISIVGKINDGGDGVKIESGSYIVPCPNSIAMVTLSNDSWSGGASFKTVMFYRNNGVATSSGSSSLNISNGILMFNYDKRKTFAQQNVSVVDWGNSIQNAVYVSLIMQVIESVFGNINSETDDGKFVKIKSDGDSAIGYVFDAEKLLPTVHEVSDSNKTDYNTIAKWISLDDGVYYVTAKNLAVTCNATDVIGVGSFDNTSVNIDPNSFVVVYTSLGTDGTTYNVKNVEFYSTHYTGGEGQLEFTFTQTTGATPTKENTTVAQFDTYAQSAMSMVNGLNSSLGTIFGDISATDDGKYLKVVKNGSDYKFEAADIMETVEIPADSTEVQLTNNTESRWLGSHNAVSLKLPTADSQLTTYKSRVVFVTSAAPISLTVPDGVKWRGDDVSSGTFSIQANTQYTIDFWNDGFSIKANVMAWK